MFNKMYLRWGLLALISIFMNIVAYLLAPLLPLFAVEKNGPINNNTSIGVEPRLPSWLSWFMTPDNSLYGDKGWKTEHCPKYYDTYLGMVLWLWRNPLYGFDEQVLGAPINSTSVVKYSGDLAVRDRPNGKEGYCYTEITTNGTTYWNYLYVKKLVNAFGTYWCFKLNLGWKLKSYAEDLSRLDPPSSGQFVLSPKLSSFEE